MITLATARAQVFDALEEGSICPCCDQRAQQYWRALYGTPCRWLIWLVWSWEAEPRWYRAPECPFRIGGDYAKLRHWGLVESHPTEATWRPTALGIDFVHLRTTVTRRVLLYDDRYRGYDKTKYVSIVEVLGKKFDYHALMRGEW